MNDKQIQPAEVTDEQIEEATNGISSQSPMARWRIARSILALRPAAVPMSDEALWLLLSAI